MRYDCYTFHTADTPVREMLTAWLSNAGFEGFEEDDEALRAYAPEGAAGEGRVAELAAIWGLRYSHSAVEPQNWNRQWEESFEPVTIPGFVTVRAHFHSSAAGATPYEIVITPQMSFGTGHHATTQLMMAAMRDLPLHNQTVLDFGTGTGVLAILAAKLGASRVLGIDNDAGSIVNAQENVIRNEAGHVVEVREGSLEAAGGEIFDGVLANINRNILLHYVTGLRSLVRPGGWCVMSGILVEDVPVIREAAQAAGWGVRHQSSEGKWAAMALD